MDNEVRGVEINTVTFYPKDFFNKANNETFIQILMQSAFPNTHWHNGNPDEQEPDYFCNGTPFEFTIASNRHVKGNKTIVAKLQSNSYSSENIENDVFSYIRESVQVKAAKEYSVTNVHLCILCLLDMFSWVSDEYGSVTHCATDYSRQRFFRELKNDYVSTGRFKNIFILFPDLCACWWIWDIVSDNKFRFQLTDDMIKAGKYPFTVVKEFYDNLFS